MTMTEEGMQIMTHHRASIAFSLGVALLISSCATPVDGTGGPDTSEEVPTFEESAHKLDDQVVQAVEEGHDLGDHDDAEGLRQAVAEYFTQARIDGVDPVEAEAHLAHLYTDEALDRAADRWTRQVDYEPSDFVYAHQSTMDTSTLNFSHAEIEGSQTVYVTWSGTLCEQDDHHAMIVVDVEEEAGELKISDLTHRSGCGCGRCVA